MRTGLTTASILRRSVIQNRPAVRIVMSTSYNSKARDEVKGFCVRQLRPDRRVGVLCLLLVCKQAQTARQDQTNSDQWGRVPHPQQGGQRGNIRGMEGR